MITARQTTIPTPAKSLALPSVPNPLAQWLKTNLRGVLWTVAGFMVLLIVWQVAALLSPDLPGPAKTLPVLWGMISNPFYDNGPNDKGIGIQVLFSLGRVFFGLADWFNDCHSDRHPDGRQFKDQRHA